MRTRLHNFDGMISPTMSRRAANEIGELYISMNTIGPALVKRGDSFDVAPWFSQIWQAMDAIRESPDDKAMGKAIDAGKRLRRRVRKEFAD